MMGLDADQQRQFEQARLDYYSKTAGVVAELERQRATLVSSFEAADDDVCRNALSAAIAQLDVSIEQIRSTERQLSIFTTGL